MTEFSAFHRLKSDEIWHFYEGVTLFVHIISPDGEYKVHRLGSPMRDPSANYQVILPRDHWCAAELDRAENTTFTYSCFGLCTAPGFSFEEFELAKRDELAGRYPDHKKLIARLCRE